MRYLKVLTIVLSIFFNLKMALGQGKSLKFSGVVIDDRKMEKYNQMIVEYNSDNGFQATGRHLLNPSIDSNGRFSFTLPNLNKPYQLDMTFYNIKATENIWVQRYFTEPGDDILIKIYLPKDEKSDSTVISGNGNEKYNLITKLSKKYKVDYLQGTELRNLDLQNSVCKDSLEIDSKINQLVSLLRKYQGYKDSIINNEKLSSTLKSIINQEFTNYRHEWGFRMGVFYDINPTFRTQISKRYFHFSKEFTDKPDSLSILCHQYLIGLLFKINREILMTKNGEPVEIDHLYKKIKFDYSGELRDQLIGNWYVYGPRFLYKSYSYSLMDSLLKDASDLVSVSYIKESIAKKRDDLAKSNKQDVYNSEFTGLNDQKLSLESLKGKVYLIDAWFTGCAGCAMFHDMFEREVYPKFKDNKNFRVLSINFDRYKKQWQNSVLNNKYTSKEYINVFTGENIAMNHPFFKYYNIKGGPYLMLVDSKGKVLYVPENFTASEMNKKIGEALDESIKGN